MASAAEWRLSPTVTLDQSVTDNARSVESGKEADMITTTTAGIAIVGNGPRLQLDFNYDLSKDIFWDNSDLNTFRHSLLGSGKVELWEDHIFIDTRASISQQSLARSGGLTASDRGAGTNDQSMVVNYSVTPNFAHRYSSWADTDLILSFSEVRFLDTDTGAANAQPDANRNITLTTVLRSGPKFSRTKWEVNGNRSFSNDDTDRESLEMSGEYAWNRHIDFLARVGRETIDNSGINADNSAEIFWRGGARITPGPKSSLRFEVGHRFGGTNISADASYKFGTKAALTISYEEEVKTERQNLTDNLNNVARDDAGQGLIDPLTGLPANPNALNFDFLDKTTLQKTFSIALNGQSGRNSYNISSSANIQEDKNLNTEDVVVTFAANINRRIWPDLSGGVNMNISSTIQSSSGAEDIIFTSGAFLSYTLQKNFSGDLRYNYLKRDSKVAGDDLEENTLSLSIRKQF
ncbi:MAG: TIGR03016 family PEP-CTERM system-associated outer membrane protein [Alphaproteobacteria bacterium]|nr:TIGR03016 family PEP-CTERM system-associated outer membrane protein [Alphaproteobacteria bacterium]